MASIVKGTFSKRPTFELVEFNPNGRSKVQRLCTSIKSEEKSPSPHTSVPIINDQSVTESVAETNIDVDQQSTSYAKRRTAVECGWEEIRYSLQQCFVESIHPGDRCCICTDEIPANAVIVCEDCGPSSTYCSSCCDRIHAFVLFHKPLVWKVCNWMFIQYAVT